MISLVTIIESESDFDNLKRNLNSLEPDWKLGVDILCLVADEELYPKVRNYLQGVADKGDCLVVFGEPFFEEVKQYLNDKNEYIFLLGKGTILPSGSLTRLYFDYLLYRGAGFVSGAGSYIKVKDFYKEFVGNKIILDNSEPNGIDYVDSCKPKALLTKTNLFKEFWQDVEDYGEYSYGINLRRKGYQNYIDNRVVLRQEEQ